MKRIPIILMACLGFLLWTSVLLAAPLDLSTFTAGPSVTESDGVVTFTEDFDYGALWFFDDYFLVPNNATILSFDYDFALGTDDYDDYLTFEVNYNPELDVDADITGGYFEFDLSPYQNFEVSLAWGLIWDFDDYAGTTASVYNIDLATAAPVPEPATMLLLGSGLAGLLGLRRKKFLKFS